MSRLFWTLAVSLGYLLSAIPALAAGQGEEPADPAPPAAERKESAQGTAQPRKVSVPQRHSTAADGETPTFQRKPVSTWIADLKDKDVGVRRAATTALTKRTRTSAPLLARP